MQTPIVKADLKKLALQTPQSKGISATSPTWRWLITQNENELQVRSFPPALNTGLISICSCKTYPL